MESFLCEKLKGRIQFHATVYRQNDGPSRVWITFDKEEIFSAADLTYAVQYEVLYQQIKAKRKLAPIPYHEDWNIMFHSTERQALVRASEEAEKKMVEKSVFESYQIYKAIMDYSSLSIEEAMESDNLLIRAFSLFDRRVGKRRLKDLPMDEREHPLIVSFYQIRCEVEGIGI